MIITIVGHGYVGLVTACVFADFGNTVWVIGHTPEKIERLKKGDPIIYEPGLSELLKKNIKAGRLKFTLSYSPAVGESDIVFITVGTPPKEQGNADLSAVFAVAKNIAKQLKPGFTVVSCKSTVPVGTNNKVNELLTKYKTKDVTVAVASCPEFLREGTAIHDTLQADRVVIGSNSKQAVQILLELHEPINGKRVITDLSSAELIKYTSNAMLATKISFANFISFYCEKTGADIETVLDAVGLDKRIGRTFLYPGLGYGGSCLPKDVKALMSTGSSLRVDITFLNAVEKINEQARDNFIQKILKFSKGNRVGIWGLSFKPNTDDIRFAPSIGVIESLLEKNYELIAYDPEATNNIKSFFGDRIQYANTPYEAAKNMDAICILTEWNEFKQVDLCKIKKMMKRPLIIDGRNIYEPSKMKELGFEYHSTGRKFT